METKRIALGTDHAGYAYKERVKVHLRTLGHEPLDFGSHSADACDYPDFVYPAARAVAEGRADLAVVFGGSGNGETMVANKVPGIRCGLCWNRESARMTKLHNNANVISIGARMVSADELCPIVDTWLTTEYEGGRHEVRVAKIHAGEPTAAAPVK